MLDVRHEAQAVVVSWDGPLDEAAADRILAALALIHDTPKIVLDLTHATNIGDTALARLARPDGVEFRGLRAHQERLLHYLVEAPMRHTSMDTSPLGDWESNVEETIDAPERAEADPGETPFTD